MEVSNAVRQVDEILNLQDQWYSDAIAIKTPALLSRLQKISASAGGTGSSGILQVKKCLAFDLKCVTLYPDELPDLILSFEFPLDYPSESSCCVKAISGSGSEYKSCTDAIEKYLEAFCGFECVELVMDWLADNKNSCLDGNNSGGNNSSSSTIQKNDIEGMVECYVLRYNHLLSGPEHKKEKSMLDAAKKARLQGGLLWGTPGVVVVVPPSTEDDAKEYGSDCRTIGKRPDGVDVISLPSASIEEAGLGGLAQQKRGGKLQELDTAKLRIACGGNEDLLRSVLGLQ